MKKILSTMFIVLTALFIASCEKSSDVWEEGDSNKSGIYLDGQQIVSLRSAFVGGAMPSPEMSSNRCHIYEKKYKTGPKWNEVKEVVYIEGVKYSDKEYTSLSQSLERIEITFPSEISGLSGTLVIPMTQGKYNGGCEKVSAVKLLHYVWENGNENKDGEIDIAITLTDGRSLRIYYAGSTLGDDYF